MIEGKQRRVERRPPPPGAVVHPWAEVSGTGGPVFIERALSALLERDAMRAANESQEALALLLGDRYEDPATGQAYALAVERATSPLESTPTRVRFDPVCLDQLAAALDDVPFDYLVVGWFHSHLGLGCRPSSVDLATHRRYFSAAHQFALILDPVRHQAGAFCLEDGALAPRPLLLFGRSEYRHG